MYYFEVESIIIEKIFGVAGAGKTTWMMGILEQHLKSGTPVYRIQYVGFTVASCNVARKRGAKYAPQLLKDKMWFRTIHSTCYALVRQYWQTNHQPFKKLVDYKQRSEFCKFAELQEPQKDDDVTEGTGDMSTGSAFFATATYMINSMLPIEEWQTCPHASALMKAEIDFPQISPNTPDTRNCTT
jgi:hypothetical protein